jgi:hypothetical protein
VGPVEGPQASAYLLQLFLQFFIVSLALEFFFQLLKTEGLLLVVTSESRHRTLLVTLIVTTQPALSEDATLHTGSRQCQH